MENNRIIYNGIGVTIEIGRSSKINTNGINAHRVNFCNRDEYFQIAFKKNGYCPSCGKSSCCGDCS